MRTDFYSRFTGICAGLTLAVLLVSSQAAHSQTDNGIPSSKVAEFVEKYSSTTSSSWRTYENRKTGQEISFNPKTSELWLNPATQRYEAVLRNSGSQPPKNAGTKPKSKKEFNPATKRFEDVPVEGGNRSAPKTEKWFNPVTKRFEDVLVETDESAQTKPPLAPRSDSTGTVRQRSQRAIEEGNSPLESSAEDDAEALVQQLNGALDAGLGPKLSGSKQPSKEEKVFQGRDRIEEGFREAVEERKASGLYNNPPLPTSRPSNKLNTPRVTPIGSDPYPPAR